MSASPLTMGVNISVLILMIRMPVNAMKDLYYGMMGKHAKVSNLYLSPHYYLFCYWKKSLKRDPDHIQIL